MKAIYSTFKFKLKLTVFRQVKIGREKQKTAQL